MDITYLGAGSVKLVGRNLTVITDPYPDSYGLGKLSSKADVVLQTALEGMGEVAGAMVIDGPGEYETKNSMITGIPARLHIDEDGHRGTVYGLDIDGINVVVAGNIAGKLDDRQLEKLGNVDVLIVPVGGHGLTLDAQGASELVAQLEPHYVVPVHFDDGATKYPVPQDGVDLFLKEMGSNPEPEAKLKIASKEAPAETQVVLLSRS